MYIDLPARTLAAWADRLTQAEMEGVREMADYPDTNDELTPGEVLEALVDWYGGLATAYQVKTLISRIYGIEL